MAKVFLSYRRDDGLDVAGRIYDRLVAHFGSEAVFMDVDTIPYGVDFRQYLTTWIAGCDVVLVVIGNQWLDVCHESGPNRGRRRLDDPTDFVRIEVAAALARGIPVVPVLVGGAAVPPPDRLPAELVDLSYRNATEVRSGRDFHAHATRLIDGLERLLRSTPASEPTDVAEDEITHYYAPSSTVDPPAVGQPTNLGFDAADREGMPNGWFNSLGYVSAVSTAYDVSLLARASEPGGRCVRLHRAGAQPKEFGSLMQRCPARRFAGRIVRFEGELQSESVEGWAGLWLRIDGPSGHPFFDNMHDRALRGTNPWRRYAIETRVPHDSEWINYGILLVGNGTLLADNCTVTVRDADGTADESGADVTMIR